MSDQIEPRLLSVPELCRYLAMPRRTVYGYVARGIFPPGAIRKIGRALRFEKSVIDAWVSAQPTGADAVSMKLHSIRVGLRALEQNDLLGDTQKKPRGE